jgi:hypothetical protein
MSSQGIVARDKDGLMPAQRNYLAKYAESGSENDARNALNLSSRRVARWHREEEDFRKAFDLTVSGVHAATSQRLKLLEEKLPDHIQALLEAETTIQVTCPYDKTHKFPVTIDNAGVRAKLVEMLMKSQGHLIDRRRIEGHIIHSEGLSQGLRMALSLWKDGKEISEQSRLELMALGLIEEEHPVERDNTIDGEAREIDPK